jgi:hypothetical protein
MVDKSISKERLVVMTGSELKVIFEALSIVPAYLSKRFVMTELLGWSDDLIVKNAKLKQEEIDAEKIGNKVGAFR